MDIRTFLIDSFFDICRMLSSLERISKSTLKSFNRKYLARSDITKSSTKLNASETNSTTQIITRSLILYMHALTLHIAYTLTTQLFIPHERKSRTLNTTSNTWHIRTRHTTIQRTADCIRGDDDLPDSTHAHGLNLRLTLSRIQVWFARLLPELIKFCQLWHQRSTVYSKVPWSFVRKGLIQRNANAKVETNDLATAWVSHYI